MSGNAEFLNGLKKTTVAREKQFLSKIWGAIFLVGSGVAMFYASGNATQYPHSCDHMCKSLTYLHFLLDFMTRLTILGVAAVGLASLYFSNKTTIPPTDYSKLRTPTRLRHPPLHFHRVNSYSYI